MKISKVILHIKSIPSHPWWECKKHPMPQFYRFPTNSVHRGKKTWLSSVRKGVVHVQRRKLKIDITVSSLESTIHVQIVHTNVLGISNAHRTQPCLDSSQACPALERQRAKHYCILCQCLNVESFVDCVYWWLAAKIFKYKVKKYTKFSATYFSWLWSFESTVPIIETRGKFEIPPITSLFWHMPILLCL